MGDILQSDTWQRMANESVSALSERLVEFVPSLAIALLILVVGWLVARVAAALSRRVLARVGLDRAMARVNLTATLRRAGLEAAPSRLAASLVFWLIMLMFLLSAAERLGLSGVTLAVDRLLEYVPRILGAALILFFGVLIGRFLRGLVASAAAAAELRGATRLGGVANVAVLLVAATVAIEQLGVDTQLLVTVVSAIVLGATLTMGVAFALGARPVVTHILAGHYLRQSLPPGSSVELRGERGTIERVGTVDTLLRRPDRSWSVPNAWLMEEIVIR